MILWLLSRLRLAVLSVICPGLKWSETIWVKRGYNSYFLFICYIVMEFVPYLADKWYSDMSICKVMTKCNFNIDHPPFGFILIRKNRIYTNLLVCLWSRACPVHTADFFRSTVFYSGRGFPSKYWMTSRFRCATMRCKQNGKDVRFVHQELMKPEVYYWWNFGFKWRKGNTLNE